MQEQVNERSIALSFRAVKFTGRELARAMSAALRQMRKARGKPKKGRQSYKRLTRTGGATDEIEVSGRIRTFERFARKYKVGYKLTKDGSVDPPKWTVYFRTDQAGALQAAFKEYVAMILPEKNKDKKPSLLAQLANFRERARSVASPVRNRERGGIEL